jgi:tetratricopeptide (TPR) repeat protein
MARKEKNSPRKTALFDPPSGDLDPRGFEALAEWLVKSSPEEVDALAAVRGLEPFHPLLHTLAGRSTRGFLVRAAALEALVRSLPSTFSMDDLERTLQWLASPVRKAVLQELLKSGWLELDPDAGYSLTEAGRYVYEMLSFLRQWLSEDASLAPAVTAVRRALDGGLDPAIPLHVLRLRLLALRREIEAALATCSEAALRRTAERIDVHLRQTEEIRELLQAVRDHAAAREIAAEIRRLLARVEGASAWLPKAIEEVRRQSLPLEAGLTLDGVFREVARRSREELAAAGKAALLPVFIPPPLVQTESLLRAATSRLPLAALRPPGEPEA